MNAPDREARDAAMKAPDWHYQPSHLIGGSSIQTYRKVELMAAQGEVGLSVRRVAGATRLCLQTTIYMAQANLLNEIYMTPQRAIALRDALNDYLADLRKEAQG